MARPASRELPSTSLPSLSSSGPRLGAALGALAAIATELRARLLREPRLGAVKKHLARQVRSS